MSAGRALLVVLTSGRAATAVYKRISPGTQTILPTGTAGASSRVFDPASFQNNSPTESIGVRRRIRSWNR